MTTPPRRIPAPLPHEMRADRSEPLVVVRPGTVPYDQAWELQREVVTRRQRDEGHDVLFLLQHPAVYTLGKRADRAHVLWSDDELRERGIQVVEVDRGGDVTYHGPGQLVGYPILRLASVRGVVEYVRALEEVLIRVLADYGVRGERSQGFTGVWVGDAKVAAIGVRVASKGVTSHGFALNVRTDLTDFGGIVPCGISDRAVCSLESLGIDTTVDEAADRVERQVAHVFGATLATRTLDQLDLQPKVAS